MSAVVKSAAGVVLEGGATTKTKRFKVKHPKRKLFRASEPLLSVFMWGVNHTVRWIGMRAIGTKLILSMIGGGASRAPMNSTWGVLQHSATVFNSGIPTQPSAFSI